MLVALLLFAAPPPTPVDSSLPRKLVVMNSYAVNWSLLSPVPSGEVSLFLGSSLRPRKRWRRAEVWSTAIGYELTVSAGAADLTAAFLSFHGDYGLVYHRHHLAAVGHGARNGRLYYAFGGGLLLFGTTPTAIEADVKLACVLGVRGKSRIRGMIGGQARIVGVLSGIPVPQIGVFTGWALF